MYPRTEYEMTKDDLKAILDACRPIPYIMVGGYTPRSLQERANDAWAILGLKMGFDHMTVRPVPGKNQRFFTAVPSETEEQKQARICREQQEARAKKIDALKVEIEAKTKELQALESKEDSVNA